MGGSGPSPNNTDPPHVPQRPDGAAASGPRLPLWRPGPPMMGRRCRLCAARPLFTFSFSFLNPHPPAHSLLTFPLPHQAQLAQEYQREGYTQCTL